MPEKKAEKVSVRRMMSQILTISLRLVLSRFVFEMFHYHQDLYLGFKKPLKDDRAVILRIEEIDKVLEEKQMRELGMGARIPRA